MPPRDYEEKRDFIRMLLDHPVQCTDVETGERFTGQAKDLSGTGLCLELARDCSPGMLLEVRIEPDKAVVPPLHALVEVVRAELEAGGEHYRVGTHIREFKS